MAINSKQQAINYLRISRDNSNKILRKLDMDEVVYQNPDWKVRDVLANIIFWEKEGIKSLQAFLKNKEYSTPEFTEKNNDKINADVLATYSKLSIRKILGEWENTRAKFIETIKQLKPNSLAQEMLCPWNKKATVSHFLNEMQLHEEQHLQDIIKNLS